MSDLDHSVAETDEGRHAPGPEEWWNESWYLDFVDGDGELAGYVRLGLHPNQNVAWWTAAVVGKTWPCVMSTPYALPLPASDAMSVHADGVDIDCIVDEPLQRFTVKATAPALVHATASGVYDPALPVQSTTVAFDLTWTTAGVPYHYVLSPRYEIPCTVQGTIRVGDETYTVNCKGQRDHSWANRDWWSFEWCWFAGWLDDGTRIHGADIRLNPDFRLSFGYAQQDGAVVPIESDLVTTEDLGDYGMPTCGTITCPPAHLAVTAQPIAFGPLLLVDHNGQRAHFNRAATRFTTDAGIAGLGWIEWNQVQRP
jgi:hypothetical protein